MFHLRCKVTSSADGLQNAAARSDTDTDRARTRHIFGQLFLERPSVPAGQNPHTSRYFIPRSVVCYPLLWRSPRVASPPVASFSLPFPFVLSLIYPGRRFILSVCSETLIEGNPQKKGCLETRLETIVISNLNSLISNHPAAFHWFLPNNQECCWCGTDDQLMMFVRGFYSSV